MSSTDRRTAHLAIDEVLRRDRLIILLALAALVALSWAYLVGGTGMLTGVGGGPHEQAMAHNGVEMGSLSPSITSWSLADAITMLLMWTVMMIGMMVPSAAPMILIYARVGRSAHDSGAPFAGAGWFAAGYLLVWSAFAWAATGLQWGLEQSLLVTPMMGAASDRLGGTLLIVSGLYQWSPLKDACLSQCRSPLVFIQSHGGFRSTPGGALSIGARHGAYCVGCCWALMLLLFVAGVMNLLWVAGISALVLLEKVSPWGRAVGRLTGSVMIVSGGLLLFGR